MSELLDRMLEEVRLPKFFKARQVFDTVEVRREDIPAVI